MSEGNPAEFHLDKSISVGHLFTTAALLITLIGGLITTDRRIEANADEIGKNQLRIVASESRLQREVERQATDRELMQDQLRRIEDKLDRVIENR